MGEESLETRLKRLKSKQERGEELTDGEVEQLKADLQQVNDAMSSLAGTFVSEYSDMVADMTDALQPLVEMTGEELLEAHDDE